MINSNYHIGMQLLTTVGNEIYMVISQYSGKNVPTMTRKFQIIQQNTDITEYNIWVNVVSEFVHSQKMSVERCGRGVCVGGGGGYGGVLRNI